MTPLNNAKNMNELESHEIILIIQALYKSANDCSELLESGIRKRKALSDLANQFIEAIHITIETA